jgi:hypothetical protein
VDIPYDYLHEIRRRSGVEQGMTQVEAERLLKPFGAELVSWTYRRLVEISAERGITPVWIFVPTLEMPLQESELTKLTRLAEEANFIVLDLSGIYENLETDRLIVAVWDKHPNASGHRLIAEQLYQALRENAEKIQMGLPPDPSAP